jgi:hypothetical protein
MSNPGLLINKKMYFSEGFNYYQIQRLIHNGGYNYTVTLFKVDEYGRPLKDATGNFIQEQRAMEIKTIYDLWSALGAENSMEIVNGVLENSEASIEATFKYIINVGKVLNHDTRRLD